MMDIEVLEQFQGKFITIEGIEGVGKTTNANFIADQLRKANVDVLVTREPGGTEIAEDIRAILLKHHQEEMTIETELLLFFAARAQHIASVIRPALEKGQCVLSDRFTDASYAYQGGGRGVRLEYIAKLENLVQGSLQPDLTFLLDIKVEDGLRRARNKSIIDRIEKEEKEFFERARKIYLERAHANRARYRVIDAGKSLEDVQKALLSVLMEELIIA